MAKALLNNPSDAEFIPVELHPVLRVSKPRRIHLQPGPSNWTHYHDSTELGICHSGTGIAVVNQRIFPFVPGDALIVWPGQMHMAWTLEGISTWQFLNFDAEAIPQDPQLRLAELPSSKKIEDSGFNQVIAVKSHPQFSQMAGMIFNELDHQPPDYESSVRHLLSIVQIWLRRELRLVSSAAPQKRARDVIQRLEPALTRMAKAYAEPLNIGKLAAACFMSESTFRRSFHAALGQSPLEYLLRLRINSACALLATTSLTIKEIALRAGYPSPSDFSRSFRKVARTSPIDYRKKHKGTFPRT
jgi:AraC-like DNA-binding protein